MAWDINYNPNVNKLLYDFKVDSISVVGLFDVLIRLRNTCLLSYYNELNCVRISRYDPSSPNVNNAQMMDDLFEFYESEPSVIKNK